MSVHDFDSLVSHIGHDIEIVYYGNKFYGAGIVNVAIECITCGEILLSYDRLENEEE